MAKRKKVVEVPPVDDNTPEVLAVVAIDPIDDPSEGVRDWHRKPDETNLEWRAFQVYRGLPAGKRTVPATSAVIYPANRRKSKDGVKPGTSAVLESAFAKHSWKSRVQAMEAHFEAIKEQAAVDALRAEAFEGVAKLRKLREDRLAMSARLRKRLDAILGKIDDNGEMSAAIDGSQAKAIRELAVAAERMALVEAGGFKGLDRLIDAYEAKALPKAADGEIPADIPADVAAGILTLLASCGDH